MRISKIKIKNLFGITEFESDSKSIELLGGNGTGKTSVLDAIRLALTNRSARDYIVKKGSTEGEILIETDTGLSINRKVRNGKSSDYKSIKQDGEEVSHPENLLRQLFSKLQLDPVEFLNMSQNAQNSLLLELVQYDWNLKTIEKWFGEIPQGVDYNQNIFSVLKQIASQDGKYFLDRQDINRDIKNKKAALDELAEQIPESFDIEKWEEYSLSDIYSKITEYKQINADIERAKQIKSNYEEKIITFLSEKNLKEQKLNAEIEKEIALLQEKKIKSQNLIEEEYKRNIQLQESNLKAYERFLNKEPISGISELEEEAKYAEKMKTCIPFYKRMLEINSQISQLKKESEKLTQKIELARNLPKTILAESKLPLGNMSIEDEMVQINGLPISNLSEGEKLSLCVDVALSNEKGLNIILIDGLEKLSTENRKFLFKKCKDSGLQFIATRTTDDKELTVIEL